ncbi:MAG: GGDEF domain-containing protein [Bacilli bacterium]|nr:GGDEF domain-containing protein [Bacilli bacterium]
MGPAQTSLEAIQTIVVCSVSLSGDAFAAPIEYELGSFTQFGLPNYPTLQDVVRAIASHSEVCEGIGYNAYCEQVRRSLKGCAEEGISGGMILPLDHVDKPRSFLMQFARKEGKMHLSFVSFGEKLGFTDIDTYVAGAFKDRLTGLFNFSTLQNHVEGHHRDGFFCLFDLNKFKDINDRYGHEVGDDVLRYVASYLIAISSSEEIFYRRSGDEFFINILGTDFNYAMGIIDKIEAYLEQMPQTSLRQYPGLECSASFGLLEVRAHSEKRLDTESYMKLVDLAMYQAKAAHKKCHYISYEDSLGILKRGDLDERLNAIAKTIKR